MQLAIDPFYEASMLRVVVKANVDHPGGYVVASLSNEANHTLATKQVSWRAERDLSGLPDLLRWIGQSYLFDVYQALPVQLPAKVNHFMPKVPALGGRRS